MARERWGSRIGVILAVAGSAVGLGNFLRFPGLAAKDGGGAFMIPYFIALFLLGVPLMWIEWTIGRFGGGFGHSTAPGMFHTMSNKNRFMKYFGAIGIFGPIVIFVYYTWVESWLLGYAWFAISGAYNGLPEGDAGAFLKGYKGSALAYAFFLITFALNIGIVWFGIRRGIETVCKIALPVLFLLAIGLMMRVFTLPNIGAGLGKLWNPDLRALGRAEVWLDAAGQVFFTLSVGIGVILTYASYLTRKDDVALSGLTAASTNELAEVILGGSIVIPAAFVLLGGARLNDILAGNFDLGFEAMPLVLRQMGFGSAAVGNLFGLAWFGLLFLAGVTSSISLGQPAIAFLEDEFNLVKRKATLLFAGAAFVLCHAVVFVPCVFGEMDFWGGSFCLVVFGTVEAILFAWVFGMDRAWTELHLGSDITIPKVYRFIIKYVTPAFLLAILGAWLAQAGIAKLLMVEYWPADVQRALSDSSLWHWLCPAVKRADMSQIGYVLATRAGMLAMFVVLAVMVRHAIKRKDAAMATAGQPAPEATP